MNLFLTNIFKNIIEKIQRNIKSLHYLFTFVYMINYTLYLTNFFTS